MDLYNITLTCLINIFIFVLIEGVVYFTLLTNILENIIQNTINNGAEQINEIINNNYVYLEDLGNKAINQIINRSVEGFAVVPPINQLAAPSKPSILDESLEFQSLAVRLYLIGTFYDQITAENSYIIKNKLVSYVVYGVFVCVIMLLIFITYLINTSVFEGVYKLAGSKLIYNTVIGFVLILVFIVAVAFTVFVNISSNVDTNAIQISILNYIKKILVNNS